MAKKLAIRTEKAPAPLQGAPYSQAVRVDNLVFVSGQIALRPGESALTGTTVAEQTEQVFANLKAILEAAGSQLDCVVKTTVFLARMEDFAEMNEVYKRHAGGCRPLARPCRPPSCPRGPSWRSRPSRICSLALPGSERGSILDLHHPQAVVRVAKRRRQGRPMGHWAPRILMSPGSAAGNAPRPVGWPLRVSFGRPRVVVLALPVQAPLVAHA